MRRVDRESKRRGWAELALRVFQRAAGRDATVADLLHALRQLVLAERDFWMRSMTHAGLGAVEQLAILEDMDAAARGAEAWMLLMTGHFEAASQAGTFPPVHICEPHAEFAADAPCIGWAGRSLAAYNVASRAEPYEASVDRFLHDLRLFVEHGGDSWATVLAPYWRAPAALRTYVCTLPEPHRPVVVVSAVRRDEAGMLAEARRTAERHWYERRIAANAVERMTVTEIDGDASASVRRPETIIRPLAGSASTTASPGTQTQVAGPMARLVNGAMVVEPHPGWPLLLEILRGRNGLELSISTIDATAGSSRPEDYRNPGPDILAIYFNGWRLRRRRIGRR